ncbi:MAG: HigA family addiction module antitoxin [Eubacteriales bacterium]|nr:HigA family addiction module antitoxin [Eubacteriales bacterium]
MKSRTFIASPPGITIREQLADRGMSQKEFAARMNMSEKHISRLINGDVQLTPDMAVRLEMVLGLPAHFWSNLENIYREKLAKAKAENELDSDLEIAKKIPYREMAEYEWVTNTHSPKERVVYLRKFFEVVQLGLLHSPLIPGIACRRLGTGEKSDYALIAWAQKAKLEARNIDTCPIDTERLRKILPEIRKMTTQPPADFCPVLCDLLAQCGIALIFLPHIGGSFLHGATFFDGSKIVIGMTVRGKDADRFWFSLFHELGHVVLGHIGQTSGTNDQDEKDADIFARDTLIPDKDFAAFVHSGNFDNKSAILSFAYSMGIDAGIVVGRLQKEQFIPYNRYGDLKTKYKLTA